MTDFANNFTAKFRDGAFPDMKGATAIVNYDQNNFCYDVTAEEMPAFIEWVALQWEDEDDAQEPEESVQEYLNRIGVTVKRV